jgi:predicted metalloprotease
MTFDPNARLDPSQVEDARGRSGGFGGMGGRTVAVGGGGIGTLIIVVILFLANGGLSGGGGTGTGGDGGLGGLGGISVGPNASTGPGLSETCKTGADANARDDCRIVGYVNSVQAYWQKQFAARTDGTPYQPAVTTFFSGQVQTACGPASTDSGPFYCPGDGHVWIDLTFFDELRQRFGATGGPLAQGYVIAHEYGHHVQDLLGDLGGASGATGATSGSVRTELQADCYAGVWAGNSVSTGFLQPISEAQVADALNAAAAVGDDRIQRATGGVVRPDAWTHGSSAQRQKWFMTGFNSKQPGSCDTSGAL